MKIALLYFSGTYNTLYLTSILKNLLLKKNNSVDVFSLENKNNFANKKYDLIGIGYPIYAFNAPKIVEQNIKNLKLSNCNYFIYKNSGEPFKFNKASSYKIYKIMKKNNTFLGEYHFLMPYNILFKTKEQFISLEMQYNLKYLNYMVDNLLNKKPYNVNLFYRFITFIFKIYRLGSKINSHFYKIDKDKCNKCHLCQKNCPTQNITYNKEKRKMVFGNKCLMCMRCSFLCPQQAISIGLLERIKLNKYYDLNNIINLNYHYDFTKENQKFYKKFQKYFNYIDSLESSNS